MLFQQYQNEFRPIYRDLQNAVQQFQNKLSPFMAIYKIQLNLLEVLYFAKESVQETSPGKCTF